MMDAILLHGVRTHNLKNIDLVLPHKKFYVITGVSGSGKSSLAFDTLYAEGQRRFVESLSAYARQFLERMEKPDAESISGIPPAIAIQAKNVVTNARSTVGTQTEINDYLRVLFSRVGVTVCPDCEEAVVSNHPETVARLLLERHPDQEVLICFKVPLAKTGNRYLKEFLPELERQGFIEFFYGGKLISIEKIIQQKPGRELQIVADRLALHPAQQKRLIESLENAYRYGKGNIQVVIGQTRYEFSEALRCFSCGRNFREPTPNLFSFNSPLGACTECQGFGRVITIDKDLVVPDPSKSLEEGAVEPWTKPSASWEFEQLLKFCKRRKIPLKRPWKKLSKKHQQVIWNGMKGDDYFSIGDFFKYLEKKTYKMHIRIFLAKYRSYIPCPVCHQSRLKPEALWVKVGGKTIQEFQELSFKDLGCLIENLKWPAVQKERVEPVHLEIKRRTRFLNEVGLDYLSLSRLSRTLSGGEVQRIHLATSLGSALVDTLYVLDEPSIGLHERDNRLLIRLLKELRDLGNTVVVVEHDKTMIEAADEVIDLGPLGGESGGKILFQGAPDAIKTLESSLTGDYLSGRKKLARRKVEQTASGPQIQIFGAREHNLKDINVSIPLKQFVAVTGVSGSGKSTLLYDILYHHFLRYRGRPVQDLGKVREIKGYEHVDDVVLIDQAPIGRTPRSNPATYLKFYDEIRKAFARTSQARREGLETRHFSFNVDGGRCPACKGDGRIKVEMHFLADVFVPCEACHGKRFQSEILDIRYQGKNIDEVLSMTIDDAARFFSEERALLKKLAPLQKVGLGYLRLGQPATTLSGGEAQRLKLAFEMAEKSAKHILYLFDEPTTGLHYYDVDFLLQALNELLSRGHSLVMIEHHIEMIQAADYVIDLGPEGGNQGGRVVYAGPIKDLSKEPKSYTGKFMKKRTAHSSKVSKAI